MNHQLARFMNYLMGHKKGYRVELPIGLELSDGDRAVIYGWPDKYAEEAVSANE